MEAAAGHKLDVGVEELRFEDARRIEDEDVSRFIPAAEDLSRPGIHCEECVDICRYFDRRLSARAGHPNCRCRGAREVASGSSAYGPTR